MTFVEAVKVFSDPFYSKGPNDQGIGWNILFSLERVGVVLETPLPMTAPEHLRTPNHRPALCLPQILWIDPP